MIQDLTSRFRARLSPNSNSPKSSKIFCKYYHPSTTVVGLKYLSITLNCIFLLVTLTTTPSTNCQKYPSTNCNQPNEQQLPPQQEHLNPYLHHRDPLQASRQQRQFNHRSSSLAGQLSHQKASSHQQLAQLQLQQQQQQQQQQQLGEQIAKQSLPQTTEVEHEEFSLALGLTNNQQQANSNYTLLPASSQNKVIPQLQVSNQTDFFAPKETSQAPQEAIVSVLNTTPAIPSDSIGSPVALQPPLTTTSSIPSNLANDNKVNIHSASTTLQAMTPTSTSTSTTTTTSTTISTTNLETQNQTTSSPAVSSQLEEINNGKNTISKQARQDQQPQPNQHSTRQGHQVGNNGEETATAQARAITQDLEPARANSIDQFQARQTSLSGDFMSPSQANSNHHTQPQFQIGQSNRHPLMDSLSQPMSSSPSSISIITPLIGPQNQQQQQQSNSHTTSVTASIGSTGLDSQQSAMMKPIFVVGNPITERDYNSNPLYYHQYQQPKLDQSYGGQIQQQQHQGHHESINKLPVSKNELEHGQQADSSPVPSHNLPQQISNKTQMPQKPAEGLTESPSSQNNQQHQPSLPSPSPQPQQLVTQANSDKQARIDKSTESNEVLNTSGTNGGDIMSTINTTSSYSQYSGIERMSGPPLIYSDGQLSSVVVNQPQSQQVEQLAPIGPNLVVGPNQQQHNVQANNSSSLSLQPPSPRLFQGPSIGGAAVLGNNPRRPSLPPPVNQANAASGFRSPMSSSGPLVGTATQQALQQTSPQQTNSLQQPVNSLMGNSASFYQNSPPYAGASNMMSPLGGLNSIYNNNNNIPVQPLTLGYNRNNIPQASPSQTTSLAAPLQQTQTQVQAQQQPQQQLPTSQVTLPQSSIVPTPAPGTAPGSGYSGRRPLNITRVEHISAECSNDLIRAVIVFNGTFKGIIYSSGYVTDPTCLYVNGTGSTRYEFNIRLNQCGTLGRQEVHQPTIPGEARRRDQVMWNTLSIQYNSIIEQEWDEHFRVSCEYGSDFWKTVSFSPFNVETNTGSPVVFTINPPQCQMDVLLGHGMGPKIAVDGPVTVGDPLTLLIHMKSEKAGYDILVKNCVAHNGGKQRMQLIDSNGCVVNERFISPFRGTYNDNDLRHVTLYAYLKAFRFTGSPVLYLECEIHMCQSACPPQMCYWRRLSKRSVDEFDYEYTTNSSNILKSEDNEQLPQQPVISDSLNLFKALQVRQESEPMRVRRQMRDIYAEDDKAALICYRNTEVLIFSATIGALFLLLITIAVTCWLRIRSLTKSQFQHNRLATTSSLSPSLLSINEAISSASSIISGAANGSLLNLSAKTCQSPSWYFQHPQHYNNRQNHLSHCHQQKQPAKTPGLLIQRQQQPDKTILPVFHGRPNGFTPPTSR